MACGMCPGYFSVWYLKNTNTAQSPQWEWIELENIDSWTLDANVQEATKKRTSSTKGLAVKFCEDVVDFTASVTTTLCKTDWLYCHILGGTGQEMSNTIETWWFFGWGNTGTSPKSPTLTTGEWAPATYAAFENYKNGTAGVPTHTDSGMFFYGKVVPPGFGGDNTATDPSTATFSINITSGPVLPDPSATCEVN